MSKLAIYELSVKMKKIGHDIRTVYTTTVYNQLEWYIMCVSF